MEDEPVIMRENESEAHEIYSVTCCESETEQQKTHSSRKSSRLLLVPVAETVACTRGHRRSVLDSEHRFRGMQMCHYMYM